MGKLILEAARANYPPCPRCGALNGDPCRTPSWHTTKPHKEREIPTPHGSMTEQ